jgi:hypothetical protein
VNALLKRSCWVLAGLLAGCQPTTENKAESQATTKVTPATSATPPAASPSPAAPTKYSTGTYRYRGTVGSQAVTVDLTVSLPALTRDESAHAQDFITCEGSYHYDRHPAGWLLLSGPQPFRPGQPLLLTEADTARPRQPTGYWQATQPFGPVLSGTWRSPAGQVLPFNLHEDYTDGQGHVVAVKYELLQEGEEEPCHPEREKGESKADYRARTEDLTSNCNEFFLHLLGPDTLRPALRALQCPVPAQRRRQMREQVQGCNQITHQVRVVYNDYGLLSLERYVEEFYEGAVHPGHALSTTTYDLRTGQPLAIAALLRPGTDSILARLLVQRLDEDMNSSLIELLSNSAADSASAPLAQLGLGIIVAGLEFTYSNYYDSVTPPVTVAVSYAELRPLLRPTSPVARMLRERGLWRQPAIK